jgi:hypothetical protein
MSHLSHQRAAQSALGALLAAVLFILAGLVLFVVAPLVWPI